MTDATQDRLAEACLRTALEERLRGAAPPDLTGRILAAARDAHAAPAKALARTPDPTVAPPRRRNHLLAAALLVGGLGVVGLVPSLVRSDANEPSQDPQDMGGAAFMPLRLDARWEYEVTDSASEKPRVQRATVAAVRRVGGRDVFRITVDDAGARFDYMAADDRGVYEYATRESYCTPMLDSTMRIGRTLPAPVGLETRWEWQQPLSMRAYDPATGASVDMPENLVEYRGELVGMREPVVVPAGRFEAAHVRAQAKGPGGERWVEHVWFARGIGVVQRTVEQGGEVRSRKRLLRFVPGTAELDRDAVLAAFLAREGEAESVVWVPLGDEEWVVRSRFAIVTRNGGQTVLRQLGETVVPFDPADKEHYTALVQDEDLDRIRNGLYPQIMAQSLCGVAVRVTAAVRGYGAVHGPGKKRVAIADHDRHCSVAMTWTARTRTGVPRQIDCGITMENGVVVQLSVR